MMQPVESSKTQSSESGCTLTIHTDRNWKSRFLKEPDPIKVDLAVTNAFEYMKQQIVALEITKDSPPLRFIYTPHARVEKEK